MANKPQNQDERLGRWVVAGMAVVALVVISWLDLTNAESVSPFVYGGLVGAIVGVDAVRKMFK